MTKSLIITTRTTTSKYGAMQLSRLFTTASRNCLPISGEQDKLYDDIDKVQADWEELGSDMERFTQETIREEVLGTSENTEVLSYIDRRETEKDNLVSASMLQIQNAQTERESRSLAVGLIDQSTRNDLDTLREVKNQLEASENVEELDAFITKLEKQIVDSTHLAERLEVTLAPYLGPEGPSEVHASIESSGEGSSPEASPEASSPKEYFPQDSSDVHQTDFPSFDPFGED